MTSKGCKDDKSLLSRCIVVVLKEKRAKRHQSKLENQAEGTSVKCPKSGRELFEDFIAENKACHWNPHLEESVKGLKYAGFLNPSTLLVGGRDIFLDTVRGAWGRKALRPPANYSISKVGELSGIDLDPIPQAQFTPLPEALCQIIHDLTRSPNPTLSQDQGHGRGLKVGASLDAVLDKLQESYKGIQQPSEQIVYETLGSLMKERKIYHTGFGYAIMTPETFQLNPCVTFQDNHLVIEGGAGLDPTTIYIPFPLPPGGLHLPPASLSPSSVFPRALPPPAAEVVSISCQTEEKDVLNQSMSSASSPEEKTSASKASKLERTHSMRDGSKGKKEGTAELGRSSSVRYSQDKAEALVKDINLRTSQLHQDKDKGEKTSLLNKLFGRSKSSKRSSSGSRQTEVPQPDAAEGDAPKPAKEYATFSAQFPPPEWQWYEKQCGMPNSHQVSPPPHPTEARQAHTWHYSQGAPRFLHDAETQSVFDDDDSEDLENTYECPLHKASTLPVGMPTPGFYPPHFVQPGFRYSEDPSGLYEHSRKHSSHNSQEGRNSQQDTSFELDDSTNKMHNQSCSKSNGHHGNPRTHRHDSPHMMMRQRSLENQSPSPRISQALPLNGDADVRPKSKPPKQDMPDKTWDIAEEPTPNDAVDLRNQDYGSAKQLLNNAQVPHRIERPTHVSRVFKKYREMKCGSFLSNDINVEYQGKLDKKAAQFAKSRDSGVNCVGLALTDQTNADTTQAKVINSGARPPGMKALQMNNLSSPELTKPSNLSPEVQAQNGTSPIVTSSAHNSVSPTHNSIVHQVLVHHSPENAHEDSGFNSPRLNELPNSSKSSPFNRSYTCDNTPPQGYVVKPDNHRRSASQSFNHSGSYQDSDPSYESLPPVLDSTDKQPSQDASQNHRDRLHSADNGSSRWSDSSKQTVRDAGSVPTGDGTVPSWSASPVIGGERSSTPLSGSSRPPEMSQNCQLKEEAPKQPTSGHRTKHSHHKSHHGALRSEGRSKGHSHKKVRDSKARSGVPAELQNNFIQYDNGSKVTGTSAVRSQVPNNFKDMDVDRRKQSDFEIVGMI